MSESIHLLHCYNRGCGKKYNPKDNKDDDCLHHPGVPIFHDTYKGWSCCNKKCIDFTEFLNIKGCTTSCHSNVKPLQPKKPVVDNRKTCDSIDVKPLNSRHTMERPMVDSPQLTLIPVISPALIEQIKDLIVSKSDEISDGKVQVGQSCKNNSCKATYVGPTSDNEVCMHHPGVPIFHEGMKYWSCCQKKTTDFFIFLEQPGCTEGSHNWISKNAGKKIECRYDWHQTAAFVVVSIYVKKYQPNKSVVKLNPIRLTADLFLIEEDSNFFLDLELTGIVDISESIVNMLPTKVEIKMKKGEPGSWSNLGFPRTGRANSKDNWEIDEESEVAEQVEAVDLSDL